MVAAPVCMLVLDPEPQASLSLVGGSKRAQAIDKGVMHAMYTMALSSREAVEWLRFVMQFGRQMV